jgi:hypothetical protein
MCNGVEAQIGIIGVDNGDCALVVNQIIVLTADYGSTESSLIFEAGERLAVALGQSLEQRTIPLMMLPEDWNWDDVMARCYPTAH